jgi:hypothetical protein
VNGLTLHYIGGIPAPPQLRPSPATIQQIPHLRWYITNIDLLHKTKEEDRLNRLQLRAQQAEPGDDDDNNSHVSDDGVANRMQIDFDDIPHSSAIDYAIETLMDLESGESMHLIGIQQVNSRKSQRTSTAKHLEIFISSLRELMELYSILHDLFSMNDLLYSFNHPSVSTFFTCHNAF